MPWMLHSGGRARVTEAKRRYRKEIFEPFMRSLGATG
jgi:hypothetical protein